MRQAIVNARLFDAAKGSIGPVSTIVIEGDMPILHTERLPLQLVFSNLITNGLTYGGAEWGRVTIRAADEGISQCLRRQIDIGRSHRGHHGRAS